MKLIKPTLLLLVILQLFCWNTQAQSWQWLKKGGSYTNLNENERVKSMAIDPQNNVYLLANVGPSELQIDNIPKTAYSYDGPIRGSSMIASFGCDGTYRWSKVIGGYKGAVIHRVKTDNLGNVYVAGYAPIPGFGDPAVHFDTDYTLPATQSGSNYKKTAFILKYNSSGVFQWLQMPQPDNLTAIEASLNMDSVDLEVDPQGNSYWLCKFHPGVFANGALTITQNETRIIKYDAQGNYTGSILIDIQSSGGEKILKLYRDHNNGHFYFTGQILFSSQEFVTIAGESLTTSKYVAAFDNMGNYLWKKTNDTVDTLPIFGEDGYLTIDDNNYIYYSSVAWLNTTTTNETFAGINFSNDATTTHPFIVKLNASGAVVNYTSGSKGWSTAISYRNGVLSLAANMQSMTWQNINIPDGVNINYKPSVLQFDAATLGILSANQMAVSGNYNPPTAVVTDSNNNIYMGGYFEGTLTAGSTTVTNNPFGSSDFYIAKFGSSNCALGVETPVFKDLNVYPNPVQSQLYFDNEEAMQYELYNVLGKKIQSGSLAVHGQVDCSSLPSGMYLLKLQNEKGEIKVVKVSRL